MGRLLYPIMLDVTDRLVVVVGGGSVAERKVRGLVESNAHVRVVSPEASEYLEKLSAKHRIEWLRREFHPGDVERAFMVFAATDDRAVNMRISQACDYEGVLFSRADAPEASEFILPATLRRGRLTMAVSTDGGSPGLAQRIRDKLAGEFGYEYATYVSLLEKARLRILRDIEDRDLRRSLLLQLADDAQLFEMARQGNEEEAMAHIENAIAQAKPSD